VPIDEVATDRVRLDSLTSEHRAGYGKSWFAEYGKLNNVDNPGGYVAPPLDGVWASGPYFHNTLWHVLRVAQVKKTARSWQSAPSAPRFGAVRREYYPGRFWKSDDDELSEEESKPC
jgi:hypothetical protein